jgi:hypothetical protein
MALSPETVDRVEVLLVYAVGILVYSLLVAGFYRVLSRRIMFYSQQRGGRIVQRTVLYALTFPFVSFGFFLLLSEALLFMSSPAREPLHVFTVAMAIVLAVRACAYINETTSEDLAKVLPLGLLGVFLITGEVQSLSASLAKMVEIVDHLETIGAFFAIVVGVEALLRILRAIGTSIKPAKRPAETTFRR